MLPIPIVLMLVLGVGICAHTRRARNSVVAVAVDRCAGCGRCVERCAHGVLRTVGDMRGVHVEVAAPERCSACRGCIGVCRFGALSLAARESSRPATGNRMKR